MARVREYQTLIAGIALALSIFAASGSVLALVLRVGQAMQQHEQIIETQGQMMHVILDKCK
jgi:hypothetical protein